MGALSARYEEACRAVLVVFTVNVAMVLYTVRGAIILGIFPSVAAAHATYRTWLLDADRGWTVRHTFQVFGRAWRGEFPRASLPGLAITAVWIVLWVDHRILASADLDTAGVVVSGVLLVVIALFAVFTTLFWAVRANFDEPGRWIARNTAQMIVARPMSTLFILCSMFLMLWLATTVPALIAVLGPSAFVFATSAIVFAFGKLPGMGVADRAVAPR